MFVVLLEDAAAMLGLIVAMLVSQLVNLQESMFLMVIASVGIGIILALAAALLAYETKGLLIGESARMMW